MSDNEEININEAGINLGKNDKVNKSNFNKYFEESNEEIVVETVEQSTEVESQIDDDTIYEIDVYNNLISGLSLLQQNNPQIQDKYLKLARHLINLKNKSKTVDLGDLEDYEDLKKVYKNEFNVSWIIPIVLDKKKIYKKLDIASDTDNEVINSYINTASNKGIQYEDFFDELKKEVQYIDEFNRDKLSFKSYRKLVYDIDEPYVIKKEFKKKELGYNLYLNQYTRLLRYFNIENKFWEIYTNNGPERFTYEQYDEDGKRIGSKEAQVLSGAYTNIIGLLVLGAKEENILDALNGQPWFDRIRFIGDATKISKNEQAIIEFKKHGLKNGDKVMILGSNSEPSIDGEFAVKIINENQFMIPVNTEDGKDGTTAQIYTTTILNFQKIELNKKILDLDTKEDYSNKYFDNASLYLFPEEEINDDEWKQICKKIIPRAGSIIDNQMKFIKDANTIDEINAVLKRFSIDFRNLGWDDYFTITEVLDEKYIQEKNIQSKFNYEKYYGEIISMREKIIGSNKEEKVEDDIIFGNKYILSKDVVKYYGKYPNAGMDVDSIASRYNWIYSSPDYGRYYFLLIELDKVKEFDDISIKDADILVKNIKEQIKTLEKELKSTKDTKNCEKRKIDPVKIYDSFDALCKDNGKITMFNKGDYALIESKKSHEDGMIYVWNGINWTQNILVKSLSDLCLLGVEQIKDFDLEKLHCLFKKACKDKKQVRLEKKIDKLYEELSLLSELTTYTTKELESKLKQELKIAELNLQIFLREIEDTRQKDTIEVYEQDLDPIYLDILKIPDTDTRDYLRNLLIKKDGIVIDKDIYSIRTGKKICCGHYYYHMKIAQGGSPEYSEKMVEEMRAIFGTEEENGMIFCSHDGKPLMLVDYDTAEGLSKTTGEVDKQRELVIDEEQELKEEIMELQSEEREAEIFECTGPEIKNELLKIGFKMEQVAKAKDICAKINAINSKTGIILKKREFINIIVDVLQYVQRIPDYARFKAKEIIQLKERGVDFKTINPKVFQERYNDFITIRKVTLVAARLLVTYQTLIPPQYPTGKKTGVVFEGFQGHTGMEYLALLIEEGKMIPIHKQTKNGKEMIQYLQMGKIKEEIRRAYDDIGELNTVKKMKKDKKLYESKQIREQEERVGVVVKDVPKYNKLPSNYQKEVEKAKRYQEFASFQKELRGRQQYIAFEIIKAINNAVSTSADQQRDDPKSLEMSCCFEEVNEELSYYKFIAQKTSENIQEMMDESWDNQYYNSLFITGGVLMKHYSRKNANFFVQVTNLGYDNERLRKNLFLTYINKGIFKGEKHDYNELGICVITGENKNDILKQKYTDDDENDLIKTIIRKNVKKIVIGGSKEDLEDLKKRDEELVDNIDYNKLKEESTENISKEINRFIEKMGKLLNRSSNKDFLNRLRERIDNLGRYNNIIEVERQQAEGDSKKIIELENEINRQKIFNLKKYINNYFRRYISMVSNMYDPNEHIKEILDVEEATSRDIQKFIFERDYFIKKYLTKRDSDIFKKLNFNVSAKVVSNINASIDIWDNNYEKIEKIVNFNVSHLADVLLFILVQNLDNFISMEFEKGIEKNKLIAQFILDVLDKIEADERSLDFTPQTFIPGDFRAQEEKGEDDEPEKIKDDATRMIKELEYKFKKVRDQTDYGEIYDELENEEKKEAAKLKFIKEYKDKFDKDPTDNEIIDYLEDQEKEEDVDKEEDEEEWMMPKVNEENDEILEIGEGYGEMPQGGEGGEDGDY